MNHRLAHLRERLGDFDLQRTTRVLPNQLSTSALRSCAAKICAQFGVGSAYDQHKKIFSLQSLQNEQQTFHTRSFLLPGHNLSAPTTPQQLETQVAVNRVPRRNRS